MFWKIDQSKLRLKNIKKKKKLCGDKINSAKRNITPDWEEKDVKYVIRNLKKKKLVTPKDFPMKLFSVEEKICCLQQLNE